MNAIILKTTVEVANELAEIGLRREHLDEVIGRMVSARNSCTENHPVGASGYMAWSEGSCRLREVGGLLPGWERNNDDYIPSIYNSKRGCKVAVCNTDDGTGLESQFPQNRNKKGSGFDKVTGENQRVFSDVLQTALNVIPISKDARGIVFWYLCVYSEGDVVRAELSCPETCERGFFKSFRKRIILMGEGTGNDGNNDGVKRRGDGPEDQPKVEIAVARKQG